MGILIWAYGNGEIPTNDERYFGGGCSNVTFAGFKTHDDVKRVFAAAKRELSSHLTDSLKNGSLDQPLILPDDIRSLALWVSHADEKVHVLPVSNISVREIIARTAESLSVPYALTIARAVGVDVDGDTKDFQDGKEIAPNLVVGLWPAQEAARQGLAL